jgi:hypothetical protein
MFSRAALRVGCIHSWVRRQNEKDNNMSRTARTIVISAAMAGLLAGTLGTTGCSSSKDDSATGAAASSAATDKHDCKGLNSCKGKGGCSQGDQGCKGKNSCKGKGGCKVT